MATLSDVPEGLLQTLAATVPSEILAELPIWELNTRLAEVRVLYAHAEANPEDGEATGAMAQAMLKAMPVERLVEELTRLNGELVAASNAGDDEEAGRAFAQIHRLKRLNPMPQALGLNLPATAKQLADLDWVPAQVVGVG